MLTVAYILAAAFAVGLLGATVALTRMAAEDFGFIGGGICAALVGPLAALLAAAPFALIAHESGPKLATLLQSDWQCTAAHQETTTSYVQTGKVMVPVTSTSNVCDSYGRR